MTVVRVEKSLASPRGGGVADTAAGGGGGGGGATVAALETRYNLCARVSSTMVQHSVSGASACELRTTAGL